MDDRLPISILLLARDETRDLAELIPALGFAREVLVVWDPRGEPESRETAGRLGARVLERPFDGFGPQRAWGLAHCTQPWVLWLDADERLDARAIRSIRAAMDAGGNGVTHHSLERSTWFLGRRIRFCGWQGERVVRLFLKDRARFDEAQVHEQVHVEGPGPGRLPGRIEHWSYRTFEECVTKCVRYARAGAAEAWRRGGRAGALDVLFRPPLRFGRQFLLQLGFLDGAHGLLLCALASAQVLFKYAELWARGRSAPRT